MSRVNSLLRRGRTVAAWPYEQWIDAHRTQFQTHFIPRIGSVGHRTTGRQTGVVNRHLGIGWEFVLVTSAWTMRLA
jgi:hypothetical protein